MEDKEKNNKTEVDNWVVCTSSKRANAKYLFNTRTGESKWLSKTSNKETAKTSNVVRNITKSKTPAQDRLKHLQKELKKGFKNKANSSTEAAKPTTNLKIAKNVKYKNDAVQRSETKIKATTTTVSSNSSKKNEKNIKLENKVESNVKCNDKLKTNVAKRKLPATPSKTPAESQLHLNVKQDVTHANSSAAPKVRLLDDKLKNNDLLQSELQKRLSSISEAATTEKAANENLNKTQLNAKRKVDKVIDVGIKKTKTNAEIKPFAALNKFSANERLNALRKVLHEQRNETAKDDNATAKETVVEPAMPAVFEVEPMDWEPVDIEEKQNFVNIIRESVAENIVENNNNYSKSRINENLKYFSNERRLKHKDKWHKNYFYIIPDTNVWLNNLTFLDELCRMKLLDTQGSILYIPYVVIKELDGLKNRETVDIRAKRAINYIHEKLNGNSQHVQAQSANDEREHLISVDIADDAIINCCLQVQQHVPHSLLLSDDTNLRNKAKCNDLFVSTKSDLLAIHTDATDLKK